MWYGAVLPGLTFYEAFLSSHHRGLSDPLQLSPLLSSTAYGATLCMPPGHQFLSPWQCDGHLKHFEYRHGKASLGPFGFVYLLILFKRYIYIYKGNFIKATLGMFALNGY